MDRPVRSVTLAVIQHFTELQDRIVKALQTLIPERISQQYSKQISSLTYKGFHGNIIIRLELVINKRKDATETFEHIVCSLSDGEQKILINTMEDRIDDSGNLYLRISKQDAYLGEIRLAEGDETIRVVVKPVHPSVDWKQVIQELCKEK
ncbi:MAG: hypothetical protein F7C32_01705 [Desulfurococcales archaeon]|nr:hypothetical protein [Desulfurococcales archaeon]